MSHEPLWVLVTGYSGTSKDTNDGPHQKPKGFFNAQNLWIMRLRSQGGAQPNQCDNPRMSCKSPND